LGDSVAANCGQSTESRERLQALIRGYRISQAVYVATRLGIPDLLADGPRDIEELAQETGSHLPSLRRVLAALAAVGVLDKIGPRRFALTEVGGGLCTGVPGSVRPAVLFLLNESHWRPWGHLLHTVRTGQTAFEHAHGASLFEFLARHPEEADLFNKGMAGNSPAHARLVAAAYDFSRMSLVIDVAGGRGRLLATILESNPHLRGILFDLPRIVEDARQLINDAGVADRCEFVGGNFFEAVPEGGNAYILRNIIHDWEDDQAVAILTTCRRAMGDGARLILVERYVAEDPRETPLVHHADLEMLVNVGGLERTSDEYATLLARGGFRLVQTISLDHTAEAMGHHLIVAQPV
jgi:hypothetical protein